MARQDFITVEVRGAGRDGQLAADFDRLQRKMQDDLNKTMREIDRHAPDEARVAAPFDTGRLRQGIESRLNFRASRLQMTLSVDARRKGFDYVDVTRYGHRVAVIRPRTKKALKVYIGGRRLGLWQWRGSVRGTRVTHDWVEDAASNVQYMADYYVSRLNRAVTVDILESRRLRS